MELGEDEAALTHLEKAAAISERLTLDFPSETVVIRDHTVSLTWVGMFYLKRQEWRKGVRNR